MDSLGIVETVRATVVSACSTPLEGNVVTRAARNLMKQKMVFEWIPISNYRVELESGICFSSSWSVDWSSRLDGDCFEF